MKHKEVGNTGENDERLVVKRLDNVIVYFRDSDDSVNKNKLKQLLLPYTKYTRLGHPAMMEPISNDIEGQGIAFADQSRVGKVGGWGRTRTEPIAKAVWALKERGEKISFETLLPEAERQFIEHSIDPDTPEWNYPE